MDRGGAGKLVNKIGQKVGAVTSGGTLLTGIGTYLEFLPALMGVLASTAAIALSLGVLYCTLKKGSLERRLLQDQIDAIENSPLLGGEGEPRN